MTSMLKIDDLAVTYSKVNYLEAVAKMAMKHALTV